MSDEPVSTSPSSTSESNLEFELVANGVDFLHSATEHLAEAENPSSLKYAVLHLQAAIEILVKVRLQREGFQHVFDDPYSADENKLRDGNFRSVSLNAALKRLDKVAAVRLPKQQRKALEFLGQERNKLQHYGSTSSHQVVAGHAAVALDVLGEFVRQHLFPNAPQDEVEHLEAAQEVIRDAVLTIAEVNDARLTRIGPELDAWPGTVIHCPDCLQLAWTFSPTDEESRCRLCGHDWSQEYTDDALSEYLGAILGESKYEAAKGRSGWSVTNCPECELEALVDVATRKDPNSYLTSACFSCGFVTAEQLGSCGRCGKTTSDPDDVICSDCLAYLVSRDD